MCRLSIFTSFIEINGLVTRFNKYSRVTKLLKKCMYISTSSIVARNLFVTATRLFFCFGVALSA